jgi:hypothetical protein
MTTRVIVLLAATVVLMTAPVMRAHDNFRFIGTITKLQEKSIDVKSKDLKTTSIRIDKQTAVVRDKKKIPLSELAVGQSVVVDAYGDSVADSLAIEIRIVPPIGAK